MGQTPRGRGKMTTKITSEEIAELRSDLDAARKEITRLRCCGNCVEWSAVREFCNYHQDKFAGNGHCDKWSERGEGK